MDIDPKEIRIDTGRHKDSGTFIRVVHLPTGINQTRYPLGNDSHQEVINVLLENLKTLLEEPSKLTPETD